MCFLISVTVVFLLLVRLQKLFFLSGFKPLVNKITDDFKKKKKKCIELIKKESQNPEEKAAAAAAT